MKAILNELLGWEFRGPMEWLKQGFHIQFEMRQNSSSPMSCDGLDSEDEAEEAEDRKI